MRTLGGNVPIGSNARSPRFRRVPFVRDMVFDHGRASAPRMTEPHMLPSTLLTVSASAELWFSRLNSTPHTITVYASQPPSPATTQHSLPGARYGLPGPDFHRLDHASFAWRTSNPSCHAKKEWIASSQALLAMTGVQTCFRILAARCTRGLQVIFATSRKQRAQGMPDARCTRGPVRNGSEECAHEHTGQRRQSDIPCAMALRFTSGSPR